MLILTRRAGETIFIGDDVTVTVLTSRGGQVRLGIAAPRTVPILRSELLSRAFNAAGDFIPADDAATIVPA